VQAILIDANVARSCADPARHETSEACLRLTHVLAERGCRLEVALTPALEDEWLRHASRAFISWWASMEARRRVRRERDRRLADYRRMIEAIPQAGIRALLEKDAHIVEMAALKHYPVISQDDAQARHVAKLAANYSLLGDIQWCNPVTSSAWEDWLRSGCTDTTAYKLT